MAHYVIVYLCVFEIKNKTFISRIVIIKAENLYY